MRIFKSHPLLKLVNSYIIDAPQPSNISYLWNFGVRRVRALFSGVRPDSIVYSSVTHHNTLYKLRVITCYIANKYIRWVVYHNSLERLGLPSIAVKISRSGYVEDNELEITQWRQFRECIQSRICRYIWSIAYDNNRSNIRWWEASRQSKKKNIFGSKAEQATKATRTLSGNKSQPRDLIAYDRSKYMWAVTRKRSFHSSSGAVTKGNRQNVLENKDASMRRTNRLGLVKSPKASAKPTLVHIVSQKLSEFKTYDGKYNKILQLVSDPFFLVACYEEINGKPGRLREGVGQRCLDGLNWPWFLRTADFIRSGLFEFKSVIYAPRKEIPMANTLPWPAGTPKGSGKGWASRGWKKGQVRLSGDNIVQKALEVILLAIWEKELTVCSHGFIRPINSVQSAVAQIYSAHLGLDRNKRVILGDIKCFDSIPHKIILSQVKKKIVDPRMLELLNKYLKAALPRDVFSVQGVSENLNFLLCNIVMHQFDEYIKFAYDLDHLSEQKATSFLPACQIPQNADPSTSNKIRYVRYADSFAILTNACRNEALMIKRNCFDVLKNKCGVELEVNNKTLTHMQDKLKFSCGALIVKQKRTSSFASKTHPIGEGGSRSTTRNAWSMVAPVKRPFLAAIQSNPAEGDKMKGTKGTGYLRHHLYTRLHKGALINKSHYDILSFYNSKIDGITNKYSFANNSLGPGARREIRFLLASCALTLARKFKLTQRKVFQKFGSKLTCPETGLELRGRE